MQLVVSGGRCASSMTYILRGVQVRVTRYRRPRYDVLVRSDGAQTMGHDQDTDDEESEEMEAVGAEDALAQFL